jgi:hypothetical protein
LSRHGYSDDIDNWSLIRWRGQVASAIKGKRGQAFLRELIEALDAMPIKRLIAGELRKDGEVCAMGAIGVKRGVDLESLDVHDYEKIGNTFGIAHQLVQEIEYENDGDFYWNQKTPEDRWKHIRSWAEENLK